MMREGVTRSPTLLLTSRRLPGRPILVTFKGFFLELDVAGLEVPTTEVPARYCFLLRNNPMEF